VAADIRHYASIRVREAYLRPVGLGGQYVFNSLSGSPAVSDLCPRFVRGGTQNGESDRELMQGKNPATTPRLRITA
jgi:hypothetical protein